MQNSLIIARILWPKNNFSEGKKTIKKVEKKVVLKKSGGYKKKGIRRKKNIQKVAVKTSWINKSGVKKGGGKQKSS